MEIRHGIVYRDPTRYAAWPANYGLWSWDDELVVGFAVGYPQPDGRFHARDRGRPFGTTQARSLNGGQTWTLEPMNAPSPGGRALSSDEHMLPELTLGRALSDGLEPQPVPVERPIAFDTPELALLCVRTGLGAGTRSWFYTSADRCRTWQGPFWLPRFGQAGIEARTDPVVSDGDTCSLFLTASREDGREGKGVFCARTVDGGRTWALRSWVTHPPNGYAIMPSTVRLASGGLLTAIRRHDGAVFDGGQHWIDLYRSDDDALTWRLVCRPVPNTGRGGNPPALLQLHDGRLCLTYGYRAAPYGIRARLSGDQGVTWEAEVILRDDGGSHDLGYTRTLQRQDGTLVTVYYYSDEPGGAAYIAATLWRP
ncbi:MAG: sialidase family protein [Anaerolineae bacterium]